MLGMLAMKRAMGLFLVVFFYLNMNLHIYTFVDLFLINHLFQGKQSLPVAVVRSFTFMYYIDR